MNQEVLYRQRNLWEQQCPACPLWSACGGTETAPCGCIHSGDERYDCDNCIIICCKRQASSTNGFDDVFLTHVNQGRDLKDIHLDQSALCFPLPLLIPLQTHKLPGNFNLNIEWAGIDIRYLLSRHKKPPLFPNRGVTNYPSAQRYARVGSTCKILAVLNGKDIFLEHFWASKRKHILEALRRWGVFAATGPTFSVYKYTQDGRPIPDSHTVSMLRRHHRVIQELDSQRIVPIPNIYWRNEKDRRNWSEWLVRNDSVNIISRDFTLTRKGKELKRLMDQLLQTLVTVERPLHIVFQGFGRAQSATVMRRVAEYGFTCSFATSDPIIKGIKGKAFVFHGSDIPSIEEDPGVSKDAIAERNIYVLQKYLNQVAGTLPVYSNRV